MRARSPVDLCCDATPSLFVQVQAAPLRVRTRTLMHTHRWWWMWVGSGRLDARMPLREKGVRLHGLCFAVVDYAATRSAVDNDMSAAVQVARTYVSKLQKAQLAAEQALDMCEWSGRS